MVRSPPPHAGVRTIHKEAALALPGVQVVYDGADCAAVGVAQTREQALEPLAGSLMDYALPRADSLPAFDDEIVAVLSLTNPLGIKAGDEGETTPAPAAVMNALGDTMRSAATRDAATRDAAPRPAATSDAQMAKRPMTNALGDEAAGDAMNEANDLAMPATCDAMWRALR
jgi:CO/xanthine dehydrogenase Mo-binding subunit